MIRLLLFTVAVSLTLSTKAQVNLVPNPSFEDTVYCSDQGRMSGCKYWVNCRETPDYNNACHIGPFSVPDNYIGYQAAATGEAYCQLWTYSITGLYREFIGVALTQPMVIGQTYEVSFKASPGTDNGYCVKTNKLGLRFSTVPFDSANPTPIDNFAHVYTNDIVADTANWTTVSGNYSADSAYTFLILGNFFDDANTDTAGPCWGFGVYYIDDVVVGDTFTGVLQVTQSSFSVLQSGANLLLKSSDESPGNVTVYNALGQLCHSSDGTFANADTIDVSSFSTGYYLIQITTKDRIYVTKHFIH